MANYDVDIEIILRGDRKLKDFQRQLDKINTGLSRLRDTQEQVKSSNPFNAAGVRTTKNLTREYVEQAKVLNARVRVQRQSIKERERELKRLVEITNQVNAAKRADDQRAAAAARASSARGKRASAAVTAGAFPLLFGGGAFQALGGAIGGAATGSMFGGVTVALQVLGGAVDGFAAKAVQLGQSLSETAGDFSAVAEAAGLARTASENYLNEIKQLGADKEALRLATQSLADVVGIEGVNALKDFGDQSQTLAGAFSQAMAQMQASISRLLAPLLAATAGAVQGAVDVGAAQASTDPRLVQIQAEIKERQRGLGRDPNLPARESIENRQAIRDLVKEQQRILAQIRKDQEDTIRLTAERLAREKEIASLTLQTPEQLRLQKALLKTNLDLTDKNVQSLQEQLITENLRVKEREILDSIAQKDLDAATVGQLLDQARLDADKERQTLRLNINSAEEAANRAQETAARRLTAEDEKREKAVQRRVEAVERELERTDKAFDRAGSQLDAIINKHKDKMAFEREYSRLIEQGSTPAAAKQAIELKKQLLELERGYDKLLKTVDAQIVKTEASLQDLKNQKGVTTEYQEQLKALDELKKRRGELEEKKEGAEGAINEALAPKTDRENLEAYLKKLQGQLNGLMNPANQLIGLAETLGGAFSESFKGLVSGSMSAQQALANLFQRTADHFLDMAAQMIAAQIKMQAVNLFMSFLNPYGSMMAPGGRYEGMPNGTLPATPPPLPPLPKALGGAVGAGRPYMVGERGPELFVPGAQGNIVPNNAMGGSNIVVNVDASGSSVQGDGPSANQLGKAIGAAVQAELIKQKRPGGLLTR